MREVQCFESEYLIKIAKEFFGSSLLIFSIAIGQFGTAASALADDSHVGDIQYSILSESHFQQLHGSEWELLKGQDVPADSKLHTLWGQPKLPDPRGVFLRCANHDQNPDLGNPEGELAIGTYRGDTFKKHNHSGSTGEDTPDHTHGHSHPGIYGNGGYAKGDNAGKNWHGGQTQGASNRHKHSIEWEGGEETRPRNITVNAFVKIRESQKASHQTEITAEWIAQLFHTDEFLKSLRKAVTGAFGSLI